MNKAIEPKMWPLPMWLRENNVSHRTFYDWIGKGLAPRVTKIGGRNYIQATDDAAWRAALNTDRTAA